MSQPKSFGLFAGQLSIFLAGTVYGWLEPLTIKLTQDPEIGMTSGDVSWLISIIEITSAIANVISGFLADRFGRKILIQSVGPLCLLGWLILLIRKNIWTLFIMRLFHGIATGVSFTVQPIYTAEISEPKLRGRLGGFFQTAIYLGGLYIFCLGPYLSLENYIFISLPAPIVFVALFSFCPESPYFLLMTGKVEEARKVLRYFRDAPDIEEELNNMKAAVKAETSVSNPWKALFFNKVERKAFVIVQIVGFAKFLTGMPVIINYATETFSKANSFLPPAEMTILLEFLLTAIAVVSAFLSDWIGRKPLLLVSCFGCFVAHCFISIYYYIEEKTPIETTPYIWMLYVGMVMYCIFSDIGLGPLLQTLQSEMFGASTRGLAGGLTEGIVAVWAFIALKTYTPVNEAFGVYLNFVCYGVVGLICGILLSILMSKPKERL